MHVGDQDMLHIRVEGRVITISVPNMSDIRSHVDHFRDYKIAIEYYPHDDPVERAEYQFWMRHPDDDHAKAWAKKNIYDKISPPTTR